MIDIIGTFDTINPTILIVDSLVLEWEAVFWNSEKANLKQTPKNLRSRRAIVLKEGGVLCLTWHLTKPSNCLNAL